MKSFAQQKKAEMPKLVIKAIKDLLEVMRSPIIYPKDTNGDVIEHKLLAVVKAREEVYVSMNDLMNLIEIESDTFRQEVIDGLKNTYNELTLITTREIGEDSGEREIEDNYLSNISKAKFLSAKVAYQILDRIEELENPETIIEEKLRKQQVGVITELYAEN